MYLSDILFMFSWNISKKLRYGYIQDEMKKCNKNKLMRHSKWRQNKIAKYGLLSIFILLSNHYYTESVSKKDRIRVRCVCCITYRILYKQFCIPYYMPR